MKSCEVFQAQLLDHLYGLLEGEESLELIEHAGRCDECRAALQHADVQRRLLAVAAVTECPDVHFEAPEETTAPAVLPLRKPAPVRTRKPIRFGRWAAAAAVLLALGGITIPATQYLDEYGAEQRAADEASAVLKEKLATERRLIDAHEEAVARARAEDKAAQQARKELADRQREEIETAVAGIRSNQLFMVVTGQQEVRPGALNEYVIKTLNMNQEQVPANLDILVRDTTTNGIVHEAKNVQSKGSYTLPLTPDAALKSSNQLALEVVARTQNGRKQGEIKETLTLARSVYVTQLVTDKPMYQPGETIRFRSLTLDRFSLKPAGDDLTLVYTLTDARGEPIALDDSKKGAVLAAADLNEKEREKATKMVRVLRGPNALDADAKDNGGPATVAKSDPKMPKPGENEDKQQLEKQVLRGIGAGEFILPENLPNGTYQLQVEELNRRFPIEKRKVTVARYRAPTLNKVFQKFDKESYGPGESVTAHVKVSRVADGEPLANHAVTAFVTVDRRLYKVNGEPACGHDDGEIPFRTSATGEVSITFKLPREIAKGDARLDVFFADVLEEPLVRAIPIVLKKVELEFFPEGGDLVAGVPNRVYFQARTVLGRPADVSGRILDAANKPVAQISTLKLDASDKTPGLQQGMGLFEFTPAAKGTYRVVVDTPTGIAESFPLPTVVADGVALAVPNGVIDPSKPIQMRLHSVGKDRELLVAAYCRGVLLTTGQVAAPRGKPVTASLDPGRMVGGVYRITVFERVSTNAKEPLKPVAERLVYRLPQAQLKLEIKTDKTVYSPGDKATLTIKSTGEDREPLPTVVMVGIVDRSVLNLADERTARSMPTHFLLTSEVRRPEELEFADVLLGPHKQARAALDLLLGTQGWRRFLESDPTRFQNEGKEKLFCHLEDVQRLMLATGKIGGGLEEEKAIITSIDLERERVRKKFSPGFSAIEERLAATAARIEQAEDRTALDQETARSHAEAENARAAYVAAVGKLAEFDARHELLQRRALILFGIVLLIAGTGSLVFGLGRHLQRAFPVYATAAGAVGLSALLVLGVHLFDVEMPGPVPVAQLSVKEDGDHSGATDERNRNTPQDVQKAHETRVPQADDPAQSPRPTIGAVPDSRSVLSDAERDQVEKTKQIKDAGSAFYFSRSKGPVAQRGSANKGGYGEPRPMHPGKGRTPGPAMPPNAGAGTGGQGDASDGFAGGADPRNIQDQELDKADEVFKKLERQIRAGESPRFRSRNDAEARQMMRMAESSLIREYAHHRRTTDGKDLRHDFTETIYWHPALVLPNGEATISFDLNDAVTSFQVVAAGHTADGLLGANSTVIESRKPFTVTAVAPVEVKAGEAFKLPVTVTNTSASVRDVLVTLELDADLAEASRTGSALEQSVKLLAGEKKELVFRLSSDIQKEGTATVIVWGRSEPFGSDGVKYTIRIKP